MNRRLNWLKTLRSGLIVGVLVGGILISNGFNIAFKVSDKKYVDEITNEEVKMYKTLTGKPLMIGSSKDKLLVRVIVEDDKISTWGE